MLSEYQFFAISQAGWVLAAPLITAIGYFAASTVPQLGTRILTASAGLVALIAFAFAVVVAPWTGAHSIFAFWVFTGMMLLAVAVDFAAVYAFEGYAWIHFLQLLFVLSLPWIWFVGVLTISHDWS